MNVCQKCVIQFGFKLADKSKTFETDEELYEHMENVHGMFVSREGETEKEAEERCAKKGIVADRTVCQCEECKILRGEGSSIRVADSEECIYCGTIHRKEEKCPSISTIMDEWNNTKVSGDKGGL